MKKRDLVSMADLSAEEAEEVLNTADRLKTELKKGKKHPALSGKVMAMIFEKPSLRTRVTFETGMFQLGGSTIYLAPADIGLGKRESVYDVAKNLERWVDFVMARVYSHQSVVELARHCSIPVINALSDHEHPCQALADFQTIREKMGKLKGVQVVFIGDGFNMVSSLFLLGALTGTHVRLACPKGYEPPKDIMSQALKLAKKSGARLEIEGDPNKAVRDADIVYTDIWVSMGHEEETEKRLKDFKGYQVNAKLMSLAPKGALFMHDMPAKRGLEVTDEVMDGPQSIIFDQAENRLHAQKGLLVWLKEASKK
ncbi:MAG: ornithine carbamoyltransferase [bacterium]